MTKLEKAIKVIDTEMSLLEPDHMLYELWKDFVAQLEEELETEMPTRICWD